MHELETTDLWFKEAVPSPTSKNQHTQLGVHFEEVAEMVAELRGKNKITQAMLSHIMICLKGLALHLKTSEDVVEIIDPHNMLKELCDQIVTAVGVGHMYKFDTLGAMEEVNNSNWSKFDHATGKPIFDMNQKIIKGPNYFKADLTHFVPD